MKREGKSKEHVGWHEVKLLVMEEVLRNKFSSANPELQQLLLDTGEQELQEGNWHNDRFYGVDLKSNPPVGENHLGKLLMKIRKEISK